MQGSGRGEGRAQGRRGLVERVHQIAGGHRIETGVHAQTVAAQQSLQTQSVEAVEAVEAVERR